MVHGYFRNICVILVTVIIYEVSLQKDRSEMSADCLAVLFDAFVVTVNEQINQSCLSLARPGAAGN